MESPVIKKKDQKAMKQHSITHAQGSQIFSEHMFTLGELDTKMYCAKFDPEDKYVACATEKGEIQIYNSNKGKLTYVLNSTTAGIPFSFVKWRQKVNQNMAKNVLVSVNSEGEIQHYHMNSGKCISTMRSDAFDPQLYTLDINPEVSKIAVAGSEPTVKIFDEEKRVLDIDLNGDGSVRPGHNNRIYCVKFVKDEPNILLSGGWDYRVITWDLREGKPVRDINGPLICGDGIDVFEDKVLTASWSQSNQLQLWDYPEGTLNKTIDWDSVLKTSDEPVNLYCGQFSKVDGCLILAGGSNTDEAKMFDRNNYEKPFFALNELSGEINSVDFANRGGKFVTAGGDGLLRIFSLNIIA